MSLGIVLFCSTFLFVSPKSSLDLSIKAAILLGSNNSFFSNSDACLTFVSSKLGFVFSVFVTNFFSFLISFEGFCFFLPQVVLFLFFLSGRATEFNFSFFIFFILFSGVGIFLLANSLIFLFISKLTFLFFLFLIFLGGACSDANFSFFFYFFYNFFCFWCKWNICILPNFY